MKTPCKSGETPGLLLSSLEFNDDRQSAMFAGQAYRLSGFILRLNLLTELIPHKGVNFMPAPIENLNYSFPFTTYRDNLKRNDIMKHFIFAKLLDKNLKF